MFYDDSLAAELATQILEVYVREQASLRRMARSRGTTPAALVGAAIAEAIRENCLQPFRGNPADG